MAQMGAATACLDAEKDREVDRDGASGTQPGRNSEFEEMVATAGPAQLAHRGGHDDVKATAAKVPRTPPGQGEDPLGRRVPLDRPVRAASVVPTRGLRKRILYPLALASLAYASRRVTTTPPASR